MKFKIERTDGRPLPVTARFFVLRIDDPSKPDHRAARAALTIYIREAWDVDPDAAKAAHDLLMETPTASNGEAATFINNGQASPL